MKIILNSVVAAVVGLMLLLMADNGWISERDSFIALTAIVVLYLWLEIVRLRRLHPLRWMINPVFLCSVLTFLLSYTATNFLYFMPRESVARLGIYPVVTPAMVKLMYLVLLAAIGMWLGYWSPVSSRLVRPLTVQRFHRRFIPSSDAVARFAIPALLGFSIVARLAQVKLGVFGYASHYQRLAEAGAFTQYLGLLAGLGKLSLVLACLQYYSTNRRLNSGILLILVLAVEVVFGFLSGFKSAVALPFVIVGLCRYLRTGTVPGGWVIFAFVGLSIAYSVIEPYRHARMSQGSKIDTSLIGIANTMIEATSGPVVDSVNSPSTLMSISSRSNLVYIGSLGLEFSDRHKQLPSGSPEFLDNLFLAPLHAFVPRAIWTSKPQGNLGLWYTRVVVGNSYSFTSTAMGPITYLYFAGGAVAVGVVFFVLGVLQRILMFTLLPAASNAGAVVFMATLATLTMIDSSVNSIFINLFRELPMLILLTLLLYTRGRRNKLLIPTSLLMSKPS